MQKKFKSFIQMFTWAITAQVLLSDLGLTIDKTVIGKYVSGVVIGLLWAFYIKPLEEKRRAQIKT